MRHLASQICGKSHIIWDWNGTLLDDAALCVEVIQNLARRHGVAPIDMDRYLRIFRFPVIDYYKDLGFDLVRQPFVDLAHEFMDEYMPRAREAPLFAGTEELLRDLAASGIASSILSATKEPDLVEIVTHHGLASHFTHICGIQDRLAVGKVDRGRVLLSTLEVPPEAVLLIGDTDHDLEVGEALGIDVLLLDGGHQHRDRLAARCVRVVSRLDTESAAGQKILEEPWTDPRQLRVDIEPAAEMNAAAVRHAPLGRNL